MPHLLKAHVRAHILPDTVAVLSLGLLVEDFRFSYIWNPGKTPILRKGNTIVKCHPPFICPGVSAEARSPSSASGDREQWEQAGAEDEPPDLCDSDDEDKKGKWRPLAKNRKAKEEDVDEEGVRNVRCRP